MNHNWIEISKDANACASCGIICTAWTKEFSCPPWATAAGGGTTPIPGGLDAQAVVKELKDLAELVDRAWCAGEENEPVALGKFLNKAAESLEQLISRLDGQGTEKPAVSEPKRQCKENETKQHKCQYGDLYTEKRGSDVYTMCRVCGRSCG